MRVNSKAFWVIALLSVTLVADAQFFGTARRVAAFVITTTLDIGGEITSTASYPDIALQVDSAIPVISLNESDAAADNGLWWYFANGESLNFQALTDDEMTSGTWATINRTGSTIDEVELNATLLDFNGAADISGSLTVTGQADLSATAALLHHGTTVVDDGFGEAQIVYEDAAATSKWQAGTSGSSNDDFIFFDVDNMATRMSIDDTSGAISVQSGVVAIQNATNPYVALVETGGGATGYFQWTSDNLNISAPSGDSASLRSDAANHNLTLSAAGALTVDGVDITGTRGTFETSWAAACTTTPTATFDYAVINGMVFLTNEDAISCTSDTSVFDSGSTDLPAAIRPPRDTYVSLSHVVDSGQGDPGCARITTGGQINIYRGETSSPTNQCTSGQFNTSGTKGINAGLQFHYMLANP